MTFSIYSSSILIYIALRLHVCMFSLNVHNHCFVQQFKIHFVLEILTVFTYISHFIINVTEEL